MTVAIVEVMGRSAQGRTEPFICRGDDGEVYYVKGRSAGRESQIKELICGHLARHLGLPVPGFDVVEVPEALIRTAARADLRSLGAGPAFGSKRYAPSTEISFSQLKRVPRRTAQDILVFDWWVRNPDRSLTESGGNPNLLWHQGTGKLAVIDHNLAFSPEFNAADFAETHVFHALLPTVFDDLAERPAYGSRLKKAVKQFQAICETLPSEWLDEAPPGFDLATIEELLCRCESDAFWKLM